MNVDMDYYLSVEVPKSCGTKYLKVVTGNEESHKPDGVVFQNMPGEDGGLSVKPLDKASSLSNIVYYDNYDEINYGVIATGTNKYTMADGELIYQIAQSTAAEENATIKFDLGFRIDPRVYTNISNILSAFYFAVGSYDDDSKAFSVESGYEADLDFPVIPRSPAECGTQNGSRNSILNKKTEELQIRIDTNSTVEMFYDKVTFDLVLPKGVYIGDIGLLTPSYYKSDYNFGTLSYEDPVMDDDENNVYKITISNGLKSKGPLNVFFNVIVSSDEHQIGEVLYGTYKNIVSTFYDGNTYTYLDATTPFKFTVIDPNTDATTVGYNDRTIYNNEVDESDNYLQRLGYFEIKNTAQTETPFDKIVETEYNVNHSDAVIKTITVPKGTEDNPEIKITGLDNSGNETTVTVDNPSKYLAVGNNSYKYYLLRGETFGLSSITSMYADIGKLTGDYGVKYAWNSAVSYKYSIPGLYGEFLNDSAGIQVVSNLHIYNKDKNVRANKNGDLSASTTYTSTDQKSMALCSSQLAVTSTDPLTGKDKTTAVKYNSSDSAPSIAPGESVKLSATIEAYNASLSARQTIDGENEDTSKNSFATTSVVTDPVFFITLPKNFVVKDLSFILQKRMFTVTQTGIENPLGNAVFTSQDLNYIMEDISYKNTTGDGSRLYKITFPKGTTLGFYDAEGYENAIKYSITVGTSKNNETRRYALSEIMQFSTEDPMTSAVTYQKNPSSTTYSVKDKYNINDGKDLASPIYGSHILGSELGFSLVKLSDVNCYNYITVTEIAGEPVNQDWYTYRDNDPNSIALLGAKSKGKYKLVIQNTDVDHPTRELKTVVPIPKKGENLGTAFMDSDMKFDINFTWDKNNIPDGFSLKYIKINKTDGNDVQNGFDYQEVTDYSQANAILVQTDSLSAGTTAEIYLDFEIGDSVEPGERNVFHNAMYYRDYVDTVQTRVSLPVAVEVATGCISGTAFFDKNRNGVQDDDEIGIPNVNVRVVDSYGKFQYVTTDENGHYQFNAVRESDVSITFDINNDLVYRMNIPVRGLTISSNKLSASETYETLINETLNLPLGKYVTLSYNANAPTGKTATGNIPKAQESCQNENIKVASNPDNMQVKGYKFVGWNTMADGSGKTYQPNETFVIDKDTVLYAQWEEEIYTLTFDYQGGSTAYYVINGQKVPLTSIKIKYGQRLDEAIKNNYNTSLYLSLPYTQGSSSNENTGSATTPRIEKNGYFAKYPCWSFTVDSPRLRYNSSTYDYTKDMTIYAIWTPKTGFSVTYDSDGGTEFAATTDLSWESNVYSSAINNVPQKAGYNFCYWEYNGNELENSDIYGNLAKQDTVTSIELKAVYKEADYTVNYDTDGGTTINSRTVSYGDVNMNAYQTPTKDGVLFDGWTYNDTPIEASQSYGDLVGDKGIMSITLKARWKEPVNKIVKYNTNGGTSVSAKTGLFDYSTNLTENCDTHKPGYTFMGWKYNDTTVIPTTKFSDLSTDDEITLDAVWQMNSDYVVKYTNVVEPIPDKTGVKWDDSGLIPTTEPKKDGYEFSAWSYENSYVTSATKLSSLISKESSINTVILRAEWDKISYSVLYDSDGGTYVLPKTGLEYNSTNLLPSGVTKEGFKLDGWYVGDVKVTSDTELNTLLSEQQHSVTLVAKWVAEKNFAVKYNLAGGTAANGDSTIADKTVAWTENNIIPADNPIKNGYVFNGWTYGTKSVNSATVYGDLAISENHTPITLVATWRKTDTITNSSTAYYTSMSYNEPWSMDFYALMMDENKQIMGNLTYGYNAYLVTSDTKPDLDTMLQHPVSNINVTKVEGTKYSQYRYIHFSVNNISISNAKQKMWVMFSVELNNDGAKSIYYSSVKERSLYALADQISKTDSKEAVLGQGITDYANKFEQYAGESIDKTDYIQASKISSLSGSTVNDNQTQNNGLVSVNAAEPCSMTFTSDFAVDSSWSDYGVAILEDRGLNGNINKYCYDQSHIDSDKDCGYEHLTLEKMLATSQSIVYSKRNNNIDLTSNYIKADYIGRTYIYQMNTPIHYSFFYQDANGVYHFTKIKVCTMYNLLDELSNKGSGNQAELAKAAVDLFKTVYKFEFGKEFSWE